VELVQKLTSTRRGTIALAALAALLAGAFIVVYLNRYRNSVNVGATPASVLVAKHKIAKGTPGAAAAAGGLFTKTTMRQSQLLTGAISDPSLLQGRVATQDIFPGQQLTTADFTAGGSSLASNLIRRERLITIPLDSTHGMIGQVQSGDHVDIFAGFNVVPVNRAGVPVKGGQSKQVLKLIQQNVPVAAVNGGASGTTGSGAGSLTLRVNDLEAEDLAFTSDNGKIWVVLRPPNGAKAVRPSLVTVETVLLGVPPIVAQRSLGGR
jgi:Flp pilus assembly protein CpaB